MSHFPAYIAGSAFLLPAKDGLLSDRINVSDWPESVPRPAGDWKIAKALPPESHPYLDSHEERQLSRFVSLGVRAAGDALDSAGLLSTDWGENMACIVGTSRGELSTFGRFAEPIAKGEVWKIKPLQFPLIARNVVVGQICISFGIQGDCQTLSLGDLSGAYAIQRALDLIRVARTDIALTGGIEVLSPLWLQSVYVAERSRPSVSANETSIIAEGACFVVLRRVEPDATATGVRLGPSAVGKLMGTDPEAALASTIATFLADHGLALNDLACITHSRAAASSGSSGLEARVVEHLSQRGGHRLPTFDISLATGKSAACASAAVVLALAQVLEAQSSGAPGTSQIGLAITCDSQGRYALFLAAR